MGDIVQEFDINNYELDVQKYLKKQASAAMVNMVKGEKYLNSKNQMFVIVDDSPIGNVHVHVKEFLNNGFVYRWVPKIILIS